MTSSSQQTWDQAKQGARQRWEATKDKSGQVRVGVRVGIRAGGEAAGAGCQPAALMCAATCRLAGRSGSAVRPTRCWPTPAAHPNATSHTWDHASLTPWACGRHPTTLALPPFTPPHTCGRPGTTPRAPPGTPGCRPAPTPAAPGRTRKSRRSSTGATPRVGGRVVRAQDQGGAGVIGGVGGRWQGWRGEVEQSGAAEGGVGCLGLLDRSLLVRGGVVAWSGGYRSLLRS